MLLRPLVVVLEDRKISPDVFLKIQAEALANVSSAQGSITTACQFLRANGLGRGFTLRYVLEQLGNLGLDLKKRPEIARIDDDPIDDYDPEAGVLNNKFILNTLKFAEFHVLRDIKHRARIPVKDSYVVVGVADEGPAYRKSGITKIGEDKVFCLVGDSVYGMFPESASKWALELELFFSLHPRPG